MMVYLEPCAGLGNRVLALATAYDIAKRTKQQLTILWDVDGAVGIELERIFELPSDIKIIYTTKLPFKQKFILRCKSEIIRSSINFMASESLNCGNIETILRYDEPKLLQNKFIQNKNIYLKAFCELEVIRNKKIFCIFNPTKEVYLYGKDIFNKIKDNTIGIHIRRTDHVEAIQNSPECLFIEKMKQLLQDEEVSYFFLATDDLQVEKKLIEIFGDKIIINEEKKFSRSDEKGMLDGVIDMLALSKCSKIIGSYGSTFNKVASFLGDVELEVLKK